MAIEIISQNDGSRINHKVYGDVYNVTYAKGVITEFETEETEETITAGPWGYYTFPFVNWEFTDRVKLDISNGEWIPLFYHCKLHCYDDEVASLRDNGALKDSAYAFQVGDEVKVLLEEGVPKYVIGPFDGKPRMGAQYFKISFTDSGRFMYCNQKIEEESIGTIPTDYYEDEPNCDQEGSVSDWVHVNKKVDAGSLYAGIHDWWFFDYYVKVGPVLYIFWIHALTVEHLDDEDRWSQAEVRVFSGVWSKALEAQCRAVTLPLATTYPDPGDDYGLEGYEMGGFRWYYYTDQWGNYTYTWVGIGTNPLPYQNPLEFWLNDNPYPPEMKEQIYFSSFQDGTPTYRILDLFLTYAWHWSSGEDFIDPPDLLYFDKMKIEGQSYYEE